MLDNEISEEIMQAFHEIFGSKGSSHMGRYMTLKFLMVGETNSNFTNEMKCEAIKTICQSMISVSDLFQLRISKSMNEGWAFTRHGFYIKTSDQSLYTSYDDFNLSVKPNIDLKEEDIMSVAITKPNILTINKNTMYKVNAYGVIYDKNQENDGLLLYEKILDYDNVQQALHKYIKHIRQILLNHSSS